MQGLPNTAQPSGLPAPGRNLVSLCEQARDTMARLPIAAGQSGLTLAEAIAKAQQQQEDKRKRELAREKQKNKTHASTHDKFHGASPGADEDKSAYWMFVEVRPTCSLATSNMCLPKQSKPKVILLLPQGCCTGCRPSFGTSARTIWMDCCQLSATCARTPACSCRLRGQRGLAGLSQLS